MTSTEISAPKVSRRSAVKAGAWSVPVIAAAVAAPGASASTGNVDLGAFRIDTTCETYAGVWYGFKISTSPDQPLPIGSTIILTADNWGVMSFTHAPAYVTLTWHSGQPLTFTVTNELPLGSVTTLFWLVGELADQSFVATVTLPSGYIGTGAKTSAILMKTGGVCSAA